MRSLPIQTHYQSLKRGKWIFWHDEKLHYCVSFKINSVHVNGGLHLCHPCSYQTGRPYDDLQDLGLGFNLVRQPWKADLALTSSQGIFGVSWVCFNLSLDLKATDLS